MSLADLKTGESGVIVRVNGHGGFRKRLIEMGFIRGKSVRCVLGAPLRDPIEYEVLGYKVSLRRSEAQNIDIVSETEAEEALFTDEHLRALEPTSRDDKIDRQLIDKALAHVAEERRHVIRVALVGNPNCGKTSLFNIASGGHEHVGNYSGVTVDAKEGHFSHSGYDITLVDLPGTYSLSAYSPEELYVRKNLIDAMPDVIVNVVDASNIERNLYLTTQLIDMNLRTVVALNMYDELKAKGDTIDIQQLSYLLGVPVCPTVSRSGEGISDLFDIVIKVYEQSDPRLSRHIHINHGRELEESIDRVRSLILQDQSIRSKYSTRYLAIKYLETDHDIERIVEALPLGPAIREARKEETARLQRLLKTSPESAIVDAKYAFIQGALAETYQAYRASRGRRTLTDRIDAVVTNQWAAFPLFLGLLFFVFWATFTLGDYPVQGIEWLVEQCKGGVSSLLSDGWVKDLLVDGIIGGVGSVLVFLPNILILYFFISLMEDSGYMSRAAFIVDKLMHRIGLHGKSFIPMVMGFGCNVPAIMATRAIENRKSRLITLSVIPFMSCAGRVPIFVLLAGAFFPQNPALATMGIYLLGIVMALLSAWVMSKFVKDDDLPFVMELPPYRVPTGKAIWRHTWEKGRQYLQKMATTILICSVAIWALMYFPRNPELPPKQQQEQSLIGHVGKAIEPALEPLGFDWRMDIGLLAGVGAKEMVVGTMGVLYGIEDAEGDDEALAESTTLRRALAGSTSRAAGLAFMVFVLLYFPCVATFIAIKSETGRWRWAIGVAVYTIVIAWLLAFAAYRIGLAVL